MKQSTDFFCTFTKGVTGHGILLGIILLLSTPWALSQEANTIGFPANGLFHGSNFDSVEVSSGNLHIAIPIWSDKGRGLGAGYSYLYDNKGWYLHNHCDKFGVCTDTAMIA